MDMQQYIFQIDCFNEGYALSRDFRLVLTNLLLIKFDHITNIYLQSIDCKGIGWKQHD